MKKLSSKALALAAAAAWLGLASSAHATWTFTGSSTSSNNSGTAGNITTMGGVSVTNGASNAGFGAGATWTTTALQYFSGGGLGMDSDGNTDPNHALDNNGKTEAVLLGFANSVVLSSIGFGFTSDNNSGTSSDKVDVSLFRYVGSGTPASLNGVAPSAMSGWELVGNYGDLIQDTLSPFNTVNTTAKGSSWWLVSAYNSGFTGAKETLNSSALDNGDDYFKLYALEGSKCTSTVAGVCGPGGSAPEPASLALVAVALVGGAAATRRRAVKNA